MEIGIISDTHGYLDPRVFKLFENCDEIWHAGDFGVDVAEQLEEFKPIRGVFGNIDDQLVRDAYPEDERFEYCGVDVWLTHIAGRPGKYDSRVIKQLKSNPPDVLVCGHSHILHVEKDAKYNNMQYINPGAAGHQGLHSMRTLLKCKIANGQLANIRLIELGTRGRRPTRAESKENS